jgi:hypothetical protein
MHWKRPTHFLRHPILAPHLSPAIQHPRYLSLSYSSLYICSTGGKGKGGWSQINKTIEKTWISSNIFPLRATGLHIFRKPHLVKVPVAENLNLSEYSTTDVSGNFLNLTIIGQSGLEVLQYILRSDTNGHFSKQHKIRLSYIRRWIIVTIIPHMAISFSAKKSI